MAAFGYGKRQRRPKIMLLAGMLMVYPYFVSNTALLWIVGVGLTYAMFVVRDD